MIEPRSAASSSHSRSLLVRNGADRLLIGASGSRPYDCAAPAPRLSPRSSPRSILRSTLAHLQPGADQRQQGVVRADSLARPSSSPPPRPTPPRRARRLPGALLGAACPRITRPSCHLWQVPHRAAAAWPRNLLSKFDARGWHVCVCGRAARADALLMHHRQRGCCGGCSAIAAAARSR